MSPTANLIHCCRLTSDRDTTAATLVFLFNRLAAAPQYQKYIRKEVSLVENLFDPSQLEHSPWLNAVIAETLRLHPPVPTGGQKTVGPSGLQLGETYIPAGVAIFTPRYSMSRCMTHTFFISLATSLEQS